MSKKPYLFFDFDGMKFDTTPSLVAYMNTRWKIASTLADYINNTDYLEDIIKKYRPRSTVTRSEVYLDLGNHYNASISHHQDVEPMQDMVEVIRLLSKKYTLWTVTARQKAGLHVIKHLVNKHIPNCISGVHCVWEHIGNGNFIEAPKEDFILNFKGEKVAFFDDSPKEIRRVQPIISSYLFDPNRLHDDLFDIHKRVFGWKHIGEIFL